MVGNLLCLCKMFVYELSDVRKTMFFLWLIAKAQRIEPTDGIAFRLCVGVYAT